jgi:hypothetical protein
VLNEKDSDESAIRFLTSFQEAVQAAEAIEPGKRAFDLPALPAVMFVLAFVRWPLPGFECTIGAIAGQGNNPPLPQCLPLW